MAIRELIEIVILETEQLWLLNTLSCILELVSYKSPLCISYHKDYTTCIYDNLES